MFDPDKLKPVSKLGDPRIRRIRETIWDFEDRRRDRELPAVEILRVTRTIRECIRSGRLNDIPELIRKGRDLYSMQLFDQHLIDLVNSGLVSMETAIYASSNPEEFERALRVE